MYMSSSIVCAGCEQILATEEAHSMASLAQRDGARSRMQHASGPACLSTSLRHEDASTGFDLAALGLAGHRLLSLAPGAWRLGRQRRSA